MASPVRPWAAWIPASDWAARRYSGKCGSVLFRADRGDGLNEIGGAARLAERTVACGGECFWFGRGVSWLRLRRIFEEGGEENAIAGEGGASEATLIAADGIEEGTVVAHVGEAGGGGHEPDVPVVEERRAVHVLDAEDGAAEGESAKVGGDRIPA